MASTPSARQHWLFGVAACLRPIAFALAGIYGSFPVRLADTIIERIR
jgi:hypothetical protein